MTNTSKNATVILITRDGMGKADLELQHKLISSYLNLLLEMDCIPGAICFYTEGVKMVVDGSPVLDLLKRLADKGVMLLVCSTCLNFYDLVDKVQVGIVGHMTDIIEAQKRAEKVITL